MDSQLMHHEHRLFPCSTARLNLCLIVVKNVMKINYDMHNYDILCDYCLSTFFNLYLLLFTLYRKTFRDANKQINK